MLLPAFLLIYAPFTIHAYIRPGPQIQSTQGEVWPKPLWQDDTGKYFQVNPRDFQFLVTNENCDILEEAISRYTTIIAKSVKGHIRADVTPVVKTIKQLQVNLTKPCEALPYYGMDESYYVHGHGQVVANSIWGILRGLETLSQMLVAMSNGMLRIPETEIYDEPRFKYRGLMLDTARHFISVSKITQLIDAMAYNKFNVFHWHMTDDSAFPFNSSKFPELASKGAYDYRMTYSKGNVADIIEHARLRGIRVIPEFDTPAHTASWGTSHPEIMTHCYGQHEGKLGPLNPTISRTYSFLHEFFSEIKMLFPDKYMHLGADEVDSDCWENNPQIQQYLSEHGKDYGDLPYMFLEQFTANISKLNRIPMLWQEAIQEHSGIVLPKNTIAQVWFNYKTAMASLTKSGYTTILSDGFYLHVGDDEPDWMQFYKVEPPNFTGSSAQKSRVVGGEACLWTEWVNDHNVISVAFPRASAVAERLWSEKSHQDTDKAQPRLEEHNCRMQWRGIEAKPANGFGYC